LLTDEFHGRFCQISRFLYKCDASVFPSAYSSHPEPHGLFIFGRSLWKILNLSFFVTMTFATVCSHIIGTLIAFRRFFPTLGLHHAHPIRLASLLVHAAILACAELCILSLTWPSPVHTPVASLLQVSTKTSSGIDIITHNGLDDRSFPRADVCYIAFSLPILTLL
jgi:hypothetical protein